MDKNIQQSEIVKYMGTASTPFQLLEEITNGFSEDRKLGSGAYGSVYKGVHTSGAEIAVKKFHNSMAEVDLKQFENEFQNLMRLMHQNIVRLVGYSIETRHEHMYHENRDILAEQKYKALCLEYMQNGSLQEHLSDENHGLDWLPRYKIIKGSCEGLKYLHEGLDVPICHLDLKPSNILLDTDMVPKLADFGLSKLFHDEKTLITERIIGTHGYMAPEYMQGKVSRKADIFSMGVVIINIMTGSEGHKRSAEMRPEDFIDFVHANWRKRLQATFKDTSLEVLCQQVKRCIKIALQCVEMDRHKRPTIREIIKYLNDTEAMIQKVAPTLTYQTCHLPAELLDTHPRQLLFPFEQNKLICSSLQLTNKTNGNVTFRLLPKKPERYLYYKFLHGVVPRWTAYTLILTMRKHQQPPPVNEDQLTLQSSTTSRVDDLEDNVTHEINLMSVCIPSGDYAKTLETTQSGMKISTQDYTDIVLCIDVHPTEPWILTGHRNYEINIWNYLTKAIFNTRKTSTVAAVHSVKFVARKGWILAGCALQCIHVYNYNTMQEVKIFKAHHNYISSLDVHQTEPYVLSASGGDHLIRIWDWDKDWKHIHTFKEHYRASQVMFNPKDINSFVSAGDPTLKMWSLDPNMSYLVAGAIQPDITFAGHSQVINCFDWFTWGDRQYLITGSGDKTAKVWDYLEKRCLQTLRGHEEYVSAVCYHPDLALLITCAGDRTIRLWNFPTFRLERIINIAELEDVFTIACLKGMRRFVIGHRHGISMMQIAHEEHVASTSSSAK